jgi:hypothetical protein
MYYASLAQATTRGSSAVNDRRDRPMNLTPASVMDYRELAWRRLPQQLFDYVDGGADLRVRE